MTNLTKARVRLNNDEEVTSKPAPTLKRPSAALAVETTNGTERYARLNKNFVIQKNTLGSTIAAHGITGIDLYVLLSILAEAQRQDRPDVRFHSEYDALRQLGMSDRTSDYDALRYALIVWSKVRFDFDKENWYRAIKFQPLGYMTKEARRRFEKERKAKQYRSRRFDRVWMIHSSKKGPGFSVILAPEFWKANRRDRFYCRAWLEVVRKLRLPYRILLALLIDAMPKINMYPDTLAATIGLRDKNPSRRLENIEIAVGAIIEATGWDINYNKLGDGRVRIRRIVEEEDDQADRWNAIPDDAPEGAPDWE